MTQLPDAGQIKQTLERTLSSDIFTTNSIYGLIIIFVVGIWIFGFIKKIISSPARLIAFILLLEIGHILAFSTALGSYVPAMKVIFKYDVLVALAQLCVGTKVADVLLWIQSYLNSVIGGAFAIALDWFRRIFNFLY